MKLWSCIYFLALTICSISRGEESDNEGTEKTLRTNGTNDTSMLSPNKSKTEAPHPTPSSSLSQMNTTVNATAQSVTKEDNEHDRAGEHSNNTSTTGEVSNSTVAPSTTTTASTSSPSDDQTVTTTTTSNDSVGENISSSSSSSWGYVILLLIILVIIILCVILYFLRRASRTYTFDLQRPSPISRLNEPTGTFEAVYVDDLDRPTSKDEVATDDLSPPPVANGNSLPLEERGSTGETAPQEQPDANGLETSPVSDTSPTSGDDSADKEPSPANSTSLFFDVLGEEQQNENNNNPSVRTSDPFVEINLDEPALCDQLLTSPEAASSVLPFTPFSFSSSSS